MNSCQSLRCGTSSSLPYKTGWLAVMMAFDAVGRKMLLNVHTLHKILPADAD
jgi:hypothetical protein